MKQRLNHSRYLDYGARGIGDREVRIAKDTPTEKQKRFVKKLCILCKENGLDPSTGRALHTRVDYSMCIDDLLLRLQAAGVDIHGNEKKAGYVIISGQDKHGRAYHNERIYIAKEDAP